MKWPDLATQNVGELPRADALAFRAGPRGLAVTRALWFIAVGLVLLLFVVNLPAYFAFLHLAAPPGAPANPNVEQLSPAGQRALAALGVSLDFYAIFRIVVYVVYLLGFLAIGALIFRHKPGDSLAVLTSLTLVLFPFGDIYNDLALTSPPVLILHGLGHLSSVTLALVFYLFPDGRFVPSWTRLLMVGWIGREALLYGAEVASTTAPAANPLAGLAAVANLWLFPLLLATLVGAQIYRYRRVSSVVQRMQTKWVVFGLALTGVGLAGLIFLVTAFADLFQPGTVLYFVSWAAFDLVLLLMPLSLGFAILRYRLWDIDILINRALVYGVLSAGIGGLYVIIVGGLGTLLQARGSLLISLLATGCVAVLFQPLRERLQHGVNRLMYGERDTPYTALARLGQRLEATLTPEAVLPTIVETVAQALRLPYAAITLRQGDDFALAASYGQAPHPGTHAPALLRMPLVYQHEQIGELLLGARRRDEPFSPADRRLVDDLCRQVEVAAHGVHLTAELQRLTQDLQHARARLVTTREEERRRLRRDLHDGLGPQLSSQALLLTSAQMLLQQDPQAAASILQNAVAQTQEAVADIRRLVYGLRPPALDDLGLVPAIQERLAQNRAGGLAFTFEMPEPLPPLPAAVEVACFRIIQEAVTNVVRHAHARSCTVRLTCAGPLVVVILDDGLGLPPAYRPGVGLTSMRERAEELGGHWQIMAAQDGGTRVEARLPYR